LYFFIGIPASLQSEFSLTPAGTKNPGHVNASVTPSRHFVYDSATVNGVAMANAKTRLAEAYTCFAPCSTKLTDIGYSYTARGETSDIYESTTHSGGYYHLTETYWANGAADQLSGLSGLSTITYVVDGEGRTYSASASSGQNPLSSTTYSTASLPTQVSLGSGDSDSYAYDPNTNRMTQYKFTVNGSSLTGNLTWNANGSLASLLITDPFNSSDTQSCSYSHDDLSRIASANCGSIWSQTFSYDAFGNLDKSGTSSFQPTYSYITNRMTQIGSSNPTYDANGNVTNDFLNAYAWDANGRPVTANSVTLTYDALGRMVEQGRGSSYTEIVYSPSGAKLALMNGSTVQKGFIALSGGSLAVYNSSGLAYYRHSDWIGSSRFASTPTRTMYSDGAYAPFGEAYAQAGTSDLSFTGMNQDTSANLFDFPAREYGIQGRWPSPDPAGMSSMHWEDPQTLNRYAYVRNSPLTEIDPTGTETCNAWLIPFTEPDGTPCPAVSGGGSGGGTVLGAMGGSAGGDPSFSVGADVSVGGGSLDFGNNEFDALNYQPPPPSQQGNYQPQGVYTVTATGWSWSADSATALQYTDAAGAKAPVTFNSVDDYMNWLSSTAGYANQLNTLVPGQTPPPSAWDPSGLNWGVNYNKLPSQYDASQPALAGPSISANTPLSTAGYAKSVKTCTSQAEAEVKASNGAISFTEAFNVCMTGS
jgi:RHS repeat-associated protein